MNSTAAWTRIKMNTAEETAAPTLARTDEDDTLRNCVRRSLTDYFANLEGEEVNNVYQTVLAEMEIPLLEKVLEHTRGNQTRAAEMLGLNRGTLRKKLKQYGLL
jgi:Fis family transcriptional regulator